MSRGLQNSPLLIQNVNRAILTDGRRKTGKLEKKERTVGAGKCYSRGVINQSEKFCVECLIISITFTSFANHLSGFVKHYFENIVLDIHY